MFRTLLTGKLHRVTTTAAEVDYIGSCAIDAALMEEAGIIPSEQIHLMERDQWRAVGHLRHRGTGRFRNHLS